MSEKYLILYQTNIKRGGCKKATVFPATEQGVDKSLKAVERGFKAMLMIFYHCPVDPYMLLLECAGREIAQNYKLVQS